MKNDIFSDLVVVKRSGQRVSFNNLKIAIAIKSAFDSVDNNYSEQQINKLYEDTLQYIKDNYKERKTINVEDIQDIIENMLQENKCFDAYDSFSNYRLRRSESRKAFSLKRQHKFVKVIEKIGAYDSKSNDCLTPEKALFDFGNTVTDEYTKSYVLDNKYLRAIEEGKIYIHNLPSFNLGFISHTHLKLDKVIATDDCLLELINLLVNAKHEINGEIIVDNLDILLETYLISKYKETFKSKLINYLDILGYLELVNSKKINDIIDKEESIVTDLSKFKEIMVNDHLTNIIKKAYEDSIIFVKYCLSMSINKLLVTLNNVYGTNNKYSISLGSSNSKEGNIIIETIISELKNLNYLENVSLIFKIIYNYSNSYLDDISSLIISGKNIKLDFINNYNLNYTSSGYRIYEQNEMSSTGRMMIANTSINMSRLGLTFRSLNKEFYDELDNLLELVKNELLFVFETLGDKNSSNYQIIFKDNILDDDKLENGQKIRKVIKNGTLNINLIGLKECSYSINKNDYNNIILTILKYINDKIAKYCLETKLNFTLSAINEISASKAFIQLDKTIFGIIDNVTSKNNYENLNEISNIDNLDNLPLVSKIQKLLTGGNELYIYLNKKISSKKVKELIIKLLNENISYVNFWFGSDKE